MNLSFEDNTFDIVVIPNVLHVISDTKKALDECYRVLKNNGLLMIKRCQKYENIL